MALHVATGPHGVWLKDNDTNSDVHIFADKTHVEIAINDKAVYSGKAACPLAIGFNDGGKISLQVRHGDTNEDMKFYDVDPALVSMLLRHLLEEVRVATVK